jgi:hypothetical protein
MPVGRVFDASVIINILGSGVAERVLRVLPGSRIVVENTSREVVRHPLDRTNPADPVAPLVAAGLLEQVSLTTESLTTFMGLVGAESPDGLGDGESAAIAVAHHLQLAVALDDQKARRIARDRFASIPLVSSVDIFALPEVASDLGNDLADAVHSALINARMRVLPEDEAWVRMLLGDRADDVPSLRRRKR